MTTRDSAPDPLEAALASVRDLADEFKQFGISEREARRSLEEDSLPAGEYLHLREHAYRPTGVALGCPLLQPDLRSYFSELSDRADLFLRRLLGRSGPLLSRVPSDAYHITLVNRTHFDTEGDKGNVRALSRAEKEQVDSIVREQNCGAIGVRYQGLLATTKGRLMVPAFPTDQRIFRLKETLRYRVVGDDGRSAALNQNYPRHVITKLGHLVVPLSGSSLRFFIGWMSEEGAKIDMPASFADVYTPLGRIPL
jgi:hypothetical protein